MINQITKVRMPDGTEVALTDWSARPIYSSVDLLSGFTDQEIRAFNYSESENVSQSANFPAGSGHAATLLETNVANASEMDSTEEYLCYAIKVEVHEFDHNTAAGGGILNFQFDEAGLPIPRASVMGILHAFLILELEVSEKAYPQAGLGWFVQGFGPLVASTDAAAAHRTFANNGWPGHESADVLPIPVHLGGTEDFSVILHNPTGTTMNFTDETGSTDATIAVRLRIYICGLHKRPTA